MVETAYMVTWLSRVTNYGIGYTLLGRRYKLGWPGKNAPPFLQFRRSTSRCAMQERRLYRRGRGWGEVVANGLSRDVFALLFEVPLPDGRTPIIAHDRVPT